MRLFAFAFESLKNFLGMRCLRVSFWVIGENQRRGMTLHEGFSLAFTLRLCSGLVRVRRRRRWGRPQPRRIYRMWHLHWGPKGRVSQIIIRVDRYTAFLVSFYDSKFGS